MSIKLYDKSGGTPQEVLLAGTPTTDLILNGTSKNPIANKTVYNALATKIESTVENLVNFYNKSQVYNKQEVRDLIGAINTLTIEVVNELPTQDISATTIYFLKQSGANTYDEYIYVDNAWVKIGDTDIDLSGYLTTANFQIAIADYYTKSAIDAMIANYYTKTQVDAMVDAKQDELTFDNVPTAGSDNPVKSGGIKTALDAKQNTLTFDSTPTADSNNPVTSDGIKDAIDDTATDIYEVMGKRSAKNLITLPYLKTSATHRGVTFVAQNDGTITFSGTPDNTLCPLIGTNERIYFPAGTYVVSDGGYHYGGVGLYFFDDEAQTINYSGQYEGLRVSGDGYVFIWTTRTGNSNWTSSDMFGYEKTFTLGSPAYVRVQGRSANSNVGQAISGTIYPMIRLAEDTDSTYQPYAKTNQQLTQDKAEQAEVDDIVNVYGAKNLLQYPYYSTTKTVSGITITDNGDGTLTLDGTATARITYDMTATASYNLLEIGKKYLISFKTSDETIDSNSWALRIYCKKDSTTVLSTTDSRGPDVAFTVPEETVGANVQFIIVSGTVLSNVVIKPMIRLASITDDTYQPYAMTNRELTERHTTVAKTFTQSSTDVATYLRNANTSNYLALGYSYNRTMITVNAIFTIKASGNALYKSDGTTATSGNENWELIKISNFPYSKAIPDGPLSGLLFLNTTDLKDLYCRKSGNDLIFTISATDYANFVGKGIRLSATIMLE